MTVKENKMKGFIIVHEKFRELLIEHIVNVAAIRSVEIYENDNKCYINLFPGSGVDSSKIAPTETAQEVKELLSRAVE